MKIKKLAESGVSLNKISQKLTLKKSTTYYWFRKFSKNKMHKVKINRFLDEEIGEIIGAFCGDGNFYKDKRYQYR